ncbi:unnamed protein product, partial [Nippostrongylus brasiliensis]|uniref:GRIP domain-containing protein n=1 Tax=Nippostrongylus brasiliensis TaxID=27835 RepID=A0A0N4YSY8_NIPBR
SLIESNERIKRLEEELLSTRCELDNARLGLLETTAVKKELEQLREELEVERSSGRAKWEEYITAFEEKITNLEKELQEAKAKNEQDKAEKKKLKAALKQLRDREKNRSEPRSEVQPVAEEQQHLQQHLEQHQQQHQHQLQQQHQQQQEQPNVVNVQQEEHQQSSATSEPASASQVEQLKMSIKELELENRLSRELNTEYSHTMLEMEKEVIALKAQVTSLRGESEHFEMELKLHEMLEEELEKELSDARQKNKELTEAMQNSEESLEQFNERAGSDAVKNEQLTNELMSEVHQLREQKLMLEEQLRAATAKDVEKMWQLKTELENAVEALKGEIWSLNGQLKASILDREQLQDRVVELDSSLAAEKKRADALDCELSEQASRQAAEAENESNRRLAECLEMETRREQVEKAYAQLSEYYSQLQAAYNVIYAQLKQFEAEKNVVASEQQTSSTAPQSEDNVLHVVDTMISELHLEVDASVDLHGKVLLIQKALREKLAELQNAIDQLIERNGETDGEF